MSRINIFPPVAIVYPNDRQIFTAQAVPPPAYWQNVLASGDIQSDFTLQVDNAQSQTAGNGGHALYSGIGIIELTVDDQCRPTSTNTLVVAAFINDISRFLYVYSLNIDATSVKVLDENNSTIYTESYSTLSGDVYRIELAAGFRLYRNGVLKHSRTNLGTTVVYPMIYQCVLSKFTAAGPTRIPQPRLIGDWQLFGSTSLAWTLTHGSLSTFIGLQTEYSGGTIPGNYVLTCSMEPAADPTGFQQAKATITIPPLQILGETSVTLQPGQKVRFKTNYDAAQTDLVAWSVVSGPGSFNQDEFTAGLLPGISTVRATCAVNGLSADITVTVPAVITNANNYTAAKVSEQIDFDTNLQLMPSFISAGTARSGTGDISPDLPPGIQAGDILLLFVQTSNQAVSTPAGWAIVTNSPQGTGTAGNPTACRISVFWKRAGVVESAPTVTDPGDHALAQIGAFRGCASSGNPWDVTAGDVQASQSTSVSIPGATTTVNNCLVVLVVANQTSTTTPQASGYTNANLANLTERSDVNRAIGTGAGFAIITGEKATAGAYGTTTATLASASTQGRMSIALKPASVTWSAALGSINSSSGVWTAPSLFGQTERILASNGTYSITLEVPILETFPRTDFILPWALDDIKRVLIGEAEDGTRTSRIKSRARRSWPVSLLADTAADMEILRDFWNRNHPGMRFIVDDPEEPARIVVYTDSDLRWEYTAAGINVSFRVKEA